MKKTLALFGCMVFMCVLVIVPNAVAIETVCESEEDCLGSAICCGGICEEPDRCCASGTVICGEGFSCCGDICCPGEYCINGLCCDSGICDGVCLEDGQVCCDGIICEAFCCVGGCCETEPCNVDTDCDDEDLCNGVETCSGTGCEPGIPVDCAAGDCNPATGECCDAGICGDVCCEVIPVCTSDEDCDMGDRCTIYSCVGGTCEPNVAVVCDDSDLCTDDSCNPATGCVYEAVSCDDYDECTVDSCDSATGCVSTPKSCDDGDLCNGIETCDVIAGCQPGTPEVCEDSDLCTDDSCNPATGCVYAPVSCASGEVCNPATGECEMSAVEIICTGFLPPFDDEIVLKKKNKRAIPVKMYLEDAQGIPITDADLAAPPVITIAYTNSSGSALESDVELLSPGLSDDGNEFRYDPEEGFWIINLAAKQYTGTGIYTVTVKTGDDADYSIEPACTGTFRRLP